jgi:hypothetical protein
MTLRVRRAPAPRPIPTFSQMAAALAIFSASPAAQADGRAKPVSMCTVDEPSTPNLVEADERLAACETSCARKERERCASQREQLARRIPVLTLRAGPGDAPPVRVEVDGVERALDIPVRVDPGVHVIRTVRAGEGAAHETQIVLDEGRTLVLTVEEPRVYAPPGGVPPPPDDFGRGGCCGGARSSRTAGLDLRAVAAAAVAIAFTAGSRKRRDAG